MAHSTNQKMSNSTPWRNTASRGVSPLTQWLDYHGQKLNLSVKGRVRGHSLHVLCEPTTASADRPPSQRIVGHYFQTSANCAEINQLLGANSSHIRHLWLYGRVKGSRQPAWTISIPLASVQHRHAQPYQGKTDPVGTSQSEKTSDDSLSVSPQTDWYALAEQGHPNAIAHYLHYILADLGVNAKIRVKVQRDRPNTTKDRLWITCRGSYSPAAALVGQPIARQIRALSLANIEDALLQFQVSGESNPDWVLRIDLTPQEDMLQEWARWGDVEAISRLVNQRLQPCHSQLLEATLKDTTLHLSCTAVASAAPSSTDQVSLVHETNSNTAADTDINAAADTAADVHPSVGASADIEDVVKAVIEEVTEETIATSSTADLSIPKTVTKLLTDLAPQGIHSAVIYGQQQDSDTPTWVEWIDLPAKHQLDRAVTPLELATNGDGEAIAFLLRRLLNPDLNTQLSTGGIRIQVLTKPHMIHVMCDAPSCPAKDDVVPRMERLLQSLELPGIRGIRIYGRRAGQRNPRWHHGFDFGSSISVVPDPTPQFAATDAYVTELVTPSTEPILRPDITVSELWNRWQTWQQRMMQMVRRSLLSTHLFVPTADSPELMLRSTPRHATVKTAIIWAAVGALALVQTDLGLKQLARLPLGRTAQSEPGEEDAIAPTPILSAAPDVLSRDETSAFPVSPSSDPSDGLATDPFSVPNGTMNEDLPIEFHHSSDDSVFDDSGFAAIPEPSAPSGSSPPPLNAPQPNRSNASPVQSVTSAELSTTLASSPYPSFNSDQLDYKLALYSQRLLDVGPPDVLVLGSSRALRGIDPAVLEQTLADLGYRDADVFNFGVNGATAQVVELILQKILLPEQLPQLIIWADGARAFNSGRDDRTYNGILASEGYERLLDGSLARPAVVAAVDSGDNTSIVAPENINDLSRSLSKSYQALDEQLSDILANLSTVYDERDRLKAILQQGFTTILPSPPPSLGSEHSTASTLPLDNEASIVDGVLTSESNANQDAADINATSVDFPASLSAIDDINTDGFLPLSIRFDPAQYYQQYARVPGNYDKDYSNFQLEGRQVLALETLVGLGQTYDIPIVFINMPLTQEYLDPFRFAHEQTFRQYMLNLALQQEQFVFRDLGQLWLDDTGHRSYFSDPSHLNRYGAYEVSQHIAKDPMIPWDVTTR